MKREVSLVFIVLIFVMIATAFVHSESHEPNEDDIKTKIEGKTGKKVNNVTQLTSDDLEKKLGAFLVNNESKISIFEAQIDNDKPVFAISSGGILEKTKPEVVSYAVSLFDFGFSGESNESVFLKTSTGVTSSLEKGYVMLRSGSITGVSSITEIVTGAENGKVEIILFKNGEQISFGNVIDASSSGVKKDFDSQSRGIVTFEAGDTLSVYVKLSEGVKLNDIVTTIESTGVVE